MEKIQEQESGIQKFPIEYKPEVLDWTDNNYWKDFNYWWTIQQLRPWIEVEESTTFYINHSSRWTWWTWLQTITWVWFKPSKIKIRAFLTTTPWASSDWHATESWEKFCRQTRYQPSQYSFAVDTSNIISLYNNTWWWTTEAYATISSYDENWFTLNWSAVWATVLFWFECYR